MAYYKTKVLCCNPDILRPYVIMSYSLALGHTDAILGICVPPTQCGIDAGIQTTYTRFYVSLAADLNYWGTQLMMGYDKIIGYEVISGLLLKLYFTPDVAICCGNLIYGNVTLPPNLIAPISGILTC